MKVVRYTFVSFFWHISFCFQQLWWGFDLDGCTSNDVFFPFTKIMFSLGLYDLGESIFSVIFCFSFVGILFKYWIVALFSSYRFYYVNAWCYSAHYNISCIFFCDLRIGECNILRLWANYFFIFSPLCQITQVYGFYDECLRKWVFCTLPWFRGY